MPRSINFLLASEGSLYALFHFRLFCVCFTGHVELYKPGKMKRRAVDRGINDDLGPKRIVRRKVRRSLSPEVEPQRKREVRNTSLYEDKYEDKYSKYDKYEGKYSHSKGSDDRMAGGGKSLGEKPRHQYTTSHDHHSTTDRSHQQPTHHDHFEQQHHKFDYSLRVGNLDMKLPDNEVKMSLFREFKQFGYINVKVLGYGKERHAFINFSREDNARRARGDMQEFQLHNHVLHVDWSKATLTRFPDLVNPSSGSKKRNEDTYEDHAPRDRGGGDHFSSNRSTRDVSYRNSSHTSSPHASSQSQQTGAGSVEAKAVVPITDPSATRTLFVGNLEQDITERELRDLFGPYGRIESVDIKLQRSTGTAYAFVKFLTINDAINAKNDMHGRQYGDYRLKIGFGRGSPSAKVWIGNLGNYADMSEVRHELDRYGLIRRVDYANGDNHAFVHFDSLDAAQAAVTSLNGYRLRACGRLVKIDLCRPAHLRAEIEEFEQQQQQQQQQQEFQSSTSSRNSSTSYHENRRPQNHHYHQNEDSGTGSGGYKRRVRDHNSTHHYGSSANGDNHSSHSTTSYYHNREHGSTNRVVNDSTMHSRSRSFDKNERNIPRKRPRPSSQDRFDTGGYRQRSRDADLNGDALFRPKRPRNGLDSHHHHHSSRTHDHPRDREHIEPMDSRKDASDGKKSLSERQDSTDKRRNDGASERAPPEKPPNPPPIATDLMSSDTALKLSDSTEPISPDSDSKSVKPDSANPDTLSELAKLFPVAWCGSLVLKNTGFPTRMHLVGGDPAVAEMLLRSKDGKGDLSALRITQRLRLEPPRLEEVNKRMSSAGPSGHCILLALPGPTSTDQSSDSSMQLRPLRSLVSYLKQKEAAGIVALSSSDSSDSASEKDAVKDVIGVLHAFPPCQFSQNQLQKITQNLGSEPSKEDHIVVLLVKGTV